MFDTVLIANRGAIACRIIRTLRAMGLRAIAVYHEQDAESLHVQTADQAICLGNGSSAETYLDVNRVLDAARASGAQAIHPGYGFLSENPAFVARCADEGYERVRTHTTNAHKAMLHLNLRMGFDIVGTTAVPGRAMRIVMERRLT